MGFVSNDAAGDRADKAGGSNSKPKSNQKVETDMSSAPESRENPINQVFDQIEDILSETWAETGFGEVTIESERENKNLIRVNDWRKAAMRSSADCCRNLLTRKSAKVFFASAAISVRRFSR